MRFFAAKHGMHGLAKAVALEYGPDRVTANSIAPGLLHVNGGEFMV